jgi:molybdopterin synthase catalytic subunit
MIRTLADAAPIDVAAELVALEALGGGGIASFTGIVRGGDGLVALTLETHEAMAARALHAIADEAARRFDLLGATLIHRHGRLAVGERIVFVGAAARHRRAALDACGFLIDWAKTKAPYWKREEWADGRARWVEARAGDDAAAAVWG